jgi:hypothetical protein
MVSERTAGIGLAARTSLARAAKRLDVASSPLFLLPRGHPVRTSGCKETTPVRIRLDASRDQCRKICIRMKNAACNLTALNRAANGLQVAVRDRAAAGRMMHQTGWYDASKPISPDSKAGRVLVTPARGSMQVPPSILFASRTRIGSREADAELRHVRDYLAPLAFDG